MRHDEFLGWPEVERAKILAKILKKDSVHTCGTVTKDWYDEDGRLADPPPYEIQYRECQGCIIKADASASLSKGTTPSRYHLGWTRPE
jgi:hypothetical protein